MTVESSCRLSDQTHWHGLRVHFYAAIIYPPPVTITI